MTKNINLQLFSDKGPSNDNNDAEPVVKTYTEEELQAEADRRVSKALEKSRTKWELEQEKLLSQKVEEAERLAKLSEEEKNKELESLRIKDLEEREAELNKKVLELEAVKQLSSKNLPTNFSSIVMASTAEEVMENIKNVETLFKEEVQAAVEEKLKGNTPRTGSAPATGMSKEDFDALDYAGKVNVYNTNKELYDKFTNKI